MVRSSLIPSEKSNSELVAGKTHSLRNGIFCVLIFLACFWLAWPVAQLGYGDDFSYIRSAEVFAQTGHIVYNGWAAAMLGWMIPWGALFIKLFGFSFMTVKISMLPVAVATLLLFHAVLIRFEITPRNAVIGTLTLGLSPLFLPLSASFMTDIPGLFVIVLCLYLCQRALTARSDWAAIGWLTVAAASNVVGGTARQIAWLGVLVMLPCTGWLLRKQRGVLVAAMGLWLVGIGVVFFCMHWFAQQPYAIPTELLPNVSWSPKSVFILGFSTVDFLGAEVLLLLFLTFPVLVAWLPKLALGKSVEGYAALFCVAVLPLLATRLMVGSYGTLWLPRIVFTRLGILGHFWGMGGDVMLLVLSSLVLAAAFGCVATVRREYGRTVSGNPMRARSLSWLLLPFSFCYFTLLLPIIWQGTIFNKCMLDILPCAILASIWLYERCEGPRLPRISVGVLVVFAFLSVAGTHNLFARQRAQLKAIHSLRAAGVPRTSIDGGFSYNGWTQVEDGGHVNDPRIRIPKGAYHPPPERPAIAKPCYDWFLTRVPDVDPIYTVARACFKPSRFPSVHYTAWLPPFRRTVEVQRVPRGSR